MIKIGGWMSKPVISAKPDDSVISAVKKMARHDIGCLVIQEGSKKIHGILTERDVLKKAVASQKDASKLKIKDIMTKNVKTVDINSSVLYLMHLMKKGGFRDTPITKDGKVVGVITSQDIIGMLAV